MSSIAPSPQAPSFPRCPAHQKDHKGTADPGAGRQDADADAGEERGECEKARGESNRRPLRARGEIEHPKQIPNAADRNIPTANGPGPASASCMHRF